MPRRWSHLWLRYACKQSSKRTRFVSAVSAHFFKEASIYRPVHLMGFQDISLGCWWVGLLPWGIPVPIEVFRPLMWMVVIFPPGDALRRVWRHDLSGKVDHLFVVSSPTCLKVLFWGWIHTLDSALSWEFTPVIHLLSIHPWMGQLGLKMRPKCTNSIAETFWHVWHHDSVYVLD